MSLVGPPPLSSNPLLRITEDLRAERAATVPFPPGTTRFSLRRTRDFIREPLPMLLEHYERYGPVFTLRIFHHNVVFMLGPEANPHILVSHASNFLWREGHLGDLIPLLGDGLLTIDRDFHRRSRRIMLPMFHRESIAAARATMVDEIETALARWDDGQRVDLSVWTRRLALRIAMRALFGLDPDRASTGVADPAGAFSRALAFWSQEPLGQIARGPGSPWSKMQKARGDLDTIIYGEIARRRATGERGQDLLSLLLDATDEDGNGLSEKHLRDEVMTLLFAGHDTTTSTVGFLFYSLARSPELVDDAGFQLGLAIDETLRMFPPAWIGPRRSIAPFTFGGVDVPGNTHVQYSSWASHHLPDVWGDPEVFRPARFAPGAREAIPKGAYVPFGGGSRTCIGMRFGELEITEIAGRILERFRLELEPGYVLRTYQSPTISPRDGMPMIVRARP